MHLYLEPIDIEPYVQELQIDIDVLESRMGRVKSLMDRLVTARHHNIQQIGPAYEFWDFDSWEEKSAN